MECPCLVTVQTRLLVLYFSGTGNTDYVARYLAGRLAESPAEVALRSIEQQPAEMVADFDLLAFGCPVYGGDSPPFLQAYLARLPAGQGRGAFVFCTKGAFAGNTVGRNLARLAERGYVPLGGGSVGMPGSDGLALVGKDSWLARSALGKDYDHLRDADRLFERMAAVLAGPAAGESLEALGRPLLRRAGSLSDSLWAALYRSFADPWRTRFWADERCQACGRCERLCPVDNVALRDGRPHFDQACVLCLRCVHQCPQEAIQIGKLTKDKFRWRGPKGQFKPLRLRPGEQDRENGEDGI